MTLILSSIPGADDRLLILEQLTLQAESRLARARKLRSSAVQWPMHANGSRARPPALSGLSNCPLTPREREVAALIARGLSNRQIADRLVLTPGTAANHVANILRKLDCANRVQVASWAVRSGLLAEHPDVPA